MTKKTIIIGHVYLYLVGAFFFLMALDCFGNVGCSTCDSIEKQLICFGISITPGIIIISLTYFLRKKENILGSILIGLSIFAFFFFKFYREFLEKIPTFIIIVFLPLLIGCLFLYNHRKKTEE